MSNTVNNYKIKDHRSGYRILGVYKLADQYPTKVAKSHERKIEKQGLQTEPTST